MRLKSIAVMQGIVPPAEWMQKPRDEEALLECVSSLSERGVSELCGAKEEVLFLKPNLVQENLSQLN